MTNYIFLSGLKVKAHIGVTEEERNKLQELYFDVQIELRHKNRFENDDLSETIDYAAIEKIICEETEKSNFKLLETLGETIISQIKRVFTFKEIEIKISKNKILESTDFVGVTLKR